MKSLSRWILALLCASAAALLKEDARMMAYVGNWQTCPSEAQLEQYTHIAIGFAVTYTYAEPKNLCSETCVIEAPLICENQADPTIISDWKSRGIKVLLSFGGAGMGGSWEGDVNDCWKYCFGREDYVIGRLVELVNTMNLDGIDLDYEYFLEDEPERGFTEGAAAINFLETVTVGLRQQMPDKLLTHAPMDVDAVAGTAYYEMLRRVAYTMDFIMPQYYNGVTRPNMDGFMNQVQGEMSPLDHYNGLLPLFEYDPTRIVFGFCINDCGGTGSNSDATQASTVITELESQFPCHGGAFFWVNLDDTNGDWSRGVNQALSFNRGCTNIGGVIPTPPPLAVPVSVPVALPAPTHFACYSSDFYPYTIPPIRSFHFSEPFVPDRSFPCDSSHFYPYASPSLCSCSESCIKPSITRGQFPCWDSNSYIPSDKFRSTRIDSGYNDCGTH
ncbi:hypothetical protein FisN_20Lh170 [Fistulifera solaris]|uniref:GH18 domain-containing protein n=1 Tax=Fistulifera solaris TaxID=1519565 RepID=A0A1Z5KRG8_FISSO|nr:hypothetical protein FisN_20Lh170 [Fistulifera solaris]|eukprot:GAX28869.1 hypothetical protein FisN_20Lh170 [Fistulifera solaris]